MCVADVPLVAQLELYTLVLHVAGVADRLRFTHIGRNGHRHQHAIGLLDVVVDGERQSLVEETEVESEVGLLALLPLDAGVSRRRGFRTNLLDGGIAEEHVVAHRVQHGVLEVADIVVTVLTPAGAELQVRQPALCLLHEFLVHDVPTHRH